MSYTARELLVLATKFDQLAAAGLVKIAKKKEKKKLDPKAKVRNKGTSSVPTNRAKDKNGKKEKKSYLERFDALIRKIGGPPGEVSDTEEVEYDPSEQTEEKAKAKGFMPANNKPGMSGTDRDLLKGAQEALNKLQYKGKDGKPLNPDGVLGPNTTFAINAYIAKNKTRIPQGFDHAGPALYTMIARDASGENKTPQTTVDAAQAKTAIDQTSSTLQRLLTVYQSGQLTQDPKSQAAWLNYVMGAYAKNSALLQQINAAVRDPQTDATAKKELQVLIPTLNANIMALGQYQQILNFSQQPAAK